MSFREWLADWISGGALTEANRKAFQEKEVCTRMSFERLDAIGQRDKAMEAAHDAYLVLARLAGLGDGSANATARNMAELARSAVNRDHENRWKGKS